MFVVLCKSHTALCEVCAAHMPPAHSSAAVICYSLGASMQLEFSRARCTGRAPCHMERRQSRTAKAAAVAYCHPLGIALYGQHPCVSVTAGSSCQPWPSTSTTRAHLRGGQQPTSRPGGLSKALLHELNLLQATKTGIKPACCWINSTLRDLKLNQHVLCCLVFAVSGAGS